MRVATIVFLFSLLSSLTFAQNTAKAPQASPKDSSAVTTDDGVKIEIHYSSPAVKGREIGVEIAEVGKRWRTGANETTTIQFDQDVTIDGQALKAGKYGINTIPGEQNTQLIFNSNWKQWGTKYDEKEDVLKIDLQNQQINTSEERLTIKADKSGKVQLKWGNYGLAFQVKAAK